MEFIGDIERFVAQQLYPQRVPLAIIAAVVIALITARAIRGRWDLIARRHSRRTFMAVVPLLFVGVPLAWYLASPLAVSTELQEAAPVAAAPVIGSPVAGASTDVSTPLPRADTGSPLSSHPAAAALKSSGDAPEQGAPAAPVVASTVTSGSFRGADEFHFGRGTARLIETAPGAVTLRLEKFAVRNGPDLYVYLSRDADGYGDSPLELGRLKADKGSFNYALPAGTDTAGYRSIVIWCKQFSVLFAVAPLA